MDLDEAPKKRRIGVAVLGLGRAGTIHAKNCIVNPRVDLRYIVDLDVEKARCFATENKLLNAKALSPAEIGVVFDDPQVLGVIIASFTNAHEEQILQCIKAKKAVFCEKPLAQTYEATENCYNEAEKHNVPLLCAFNRRFDPSHSSVRDGVSKGRIGQLQVVKTCSRDSPLPHLSYLKVSHGIFQDCAIHDIDLIMWVVGEKPTTVMTQAHAFNQDIASINDVDTVAITMKFPCGVVSLTDLSRFAAYGYDQRLEAFGSAGMLQSTNQTALSVCHSDATGIQDPCIKYSFPQRYADSYRIELDHFLDVIEGADLCVTKQDVLAACSVARACEDSHRAGKPVALTWD